jgi:hypothetical protein
VVDRLATAERGACLQEVEGRPCIKLFGRRTNHFKLVHEERETPRREPELVGDDRFHELLEMVVGPLER